MFIQTKLWSVGILLALALVVYTVGIKTTPGEMHQSDTVTSESDSTVPQVEGVQLANPASVNCVQTLGGSLEMVEGEGGQAGYCHLEDGRVCEEWALFRDNSCVSPK